MKNRIQISLLSFLLLSGSVYSQNQTDAVRKETKSTTTDDFQQFCLMHALHYFESSKAITINGTVAKISKENPTPEDLGIVLLEDKAQVYQVAGTNTYVKVESLYRLRLQYNASKNKK